MTTKEQAIESLGILHQHITDCLINLSLEKRPTGMADVNRQIVIITATLEAMAPDNNKWGNSTMYSSQQMKDIKRFVSA